MALSVLIQDTVPGADSNNNEFSLELSSSIITVRELIRARVYAEVEAYNKKPVEFFQGLVQPTETENALNGYKMKERRQINPENQFKQALRAFKSNGFFILVGDYQPETLDEELELKQDDEVTFLRLMPLVGG